MLDKPRAGLRYRPAGTSTTTTGTTVTISELITLPLTGTGVGFYQSVASNQNFFGVSITKP